VSVIAIDALAGAGLQVGLTTPIEPDGASGRIKRTGLSTEIIDMHELTGVSAKRLLGLGLQSAAGAPVVVDGRLWGVLGFAWFDRHPAVSNLESRMRAFTDLAATAIANAYSRAELAASRARLVVAADETRRRIERDLHDGVQQRLVSLALAMRTACAQVPEEFHDLRLSLTEAEQGVNEALEDLQEISRGIHPAILNKGGLEPALRALARRTLLPVELSIELPERLPAAIEAVLYYLVSEAVTNATKHADAHSMLVKLGVAHGVVEAAIADDGVGGADPDRGSGLVGLRDRVESVGGTLAVESSPGRGTRLIASIPLEGGLVTSVHERDVLGGGEAPAGGDEVPPDANLGAPAPVTDTPPRATDTPAPGAEDQPPQIRM
jgi:signal transduction histidine kinase